MMEESEPVGIDAPPEKDQRVQHDGKTYTTVREGRGFILVPPHERTPVDPPAKGNQGGLGHQCHANGV